MLTDKLRDGAHGKVFKILFWIIILSFIFAGVGNYLIPRLDNSPAKIGDYKIGVEQWNGQYQDQTRQLQRQYGAAVSKLFENPEYVKAMRLQVLERIIDNVALSTVTLDQGIRVGDEQVKDAIRKEKAFFKDGKFNNDLFVASVKNMGSSPDHFAEQIRASLVQDTLANPIILSQAQAFPYEVEELAKLLTQERVVDTYTADTKAIAKDITVSDDEAKAYYDKNHDTFMKPSQVQFSYILLSAKDLEKNVEVTDEALDEYYNLNSTDFAIPEKRVCSQILVKATTENFEQKAKEALAKLQSGASFEEVGAQYSDDKDFAKSKGSLGELEKGSLSQQLDIALFAIKDKGQYSPVVIDNAGAHILKLDDIIASKIPSLADIKDEVTSKFVQSKAMEMYNEKSQTLSNVSYEKPDSLDDSAKEVGVEVKQSGVVSLGDKSLAWPLNDDEVQKAAFNETNRTSNQNSPVVNLSDSACLVLNVSDYQDAKLEAFDTVKDKAIELAKSSKVNEVARKALESIKTAVKEGKEVKAEANIKVQSDVVVPRNSPNFDELFSLSVFAIPNTKLDSTITSIKGEPTLAVLKEVRQNDEDLDKYTDLIRTQLVQFKQNKANSMLYLGARENCDVEYNEAAINLVIQQNSSAE
ncbi:MAG: SurA N-terminal domain-containing protein [Succinivibrio sp.]|jgi:peptidyl-prolyl cis-trans isomerase D|nr:SurA N-terminal domain-containing protein [Succinivibrio sp.]